MENAAKIKALLEKYLDHTASEEEMREFYLALENNTKDEEWEEWLRPVFLEKREQTPYHREDWEAVIDGILDGSGKDIAMQEMPSMEMPAKEAPILSLTWRRLTAAAVFVGLIAGGAFWLRERRPVAVQTAPLAANNKHDVAPGGNKAILTLGDGSEIILDSAHNGELSKQGNVKVIKLDSGLLSYHTHTGASPDKEIVYNTIATPRGGQYQIVLPDGSRVWLNSASSLKFPTSFAGKERMVTITGEGYFEVARLAVGGSGDHGRMPFIVKINTPSGIGGEVEVLGTHFNINAYPDESDLKVSLLEGSVNVAKGGKTRKLKPMQQARLKGTDIQARLKEPDIKVVDEIDGEEVIAWKNGLFQFEQYDIQEVMRQISRWYDVDIVYEGKIPDGHFSGLVNRANDISQVLKIMQAGGIRFKIEGRKIIVLS